MTTPQDTTKYISNANDRNSNLIRAYGRAAYNAVSLGLAQRHRIHSASTADYFFRLGHYGDCAAICYEILSAQPLPSEAIQARAHMYLAMEFVGPDEAAERLFHAERAMQLWEVVVDRRGASRFPIEKAREEKEEAVALAEAAQVSVEEGEDVKMSQAEDGEGRDHDFKA